jgi:endonuclease/exonuclease/phosphatase family metal-dependent hydrolase
MSRARRAVVIASLAAVAIAGSSVAADAKKRGKPPRVTAMSRNLYLGSDLTAALVAPNLVEASEAAGQIWRNIQETNFIARAKPLAQEIADANADAVGLQEVAIVRRDTTGEADGTATPATEVVYDFLHQLRSELRERGVNYRVASLQTEGDLELPLDFVDDGTPNGVAYDGRLTIRDVILIKDSKRLKFSRERSANYDAAFPVDVPPAGAGPEDLEILRGYNAVNAVKKQASGRKGGRYGERRKRALGKAKFRFVNTHLEAISAFHRAEQASELLASGALDHTKQTILVGDLNSDPDDPDVQGPPLSPTPTADAAAYDTIADAGFVDVGVAVNTCCHAGDLLNPPAAFSSRIDHVLVSPARTRIRGGLVGDDPAMRTPTGLWPSDHGGVFSRLRLKR